MLKLEIQNSYKRDLKLAYKQNIITHKIQTELKFVIDTLQSGKTLPEKPYRPHGLNGEYSGYTSCHIKANFCLIYKIAGNNLHLIRVGKHTTLYKNF